MLAAERFVFSEHTLFVSLDLFFIQQAGNHAHSSRRVQNMDYISRKMRRDFHRRVRLASRRAANQQRLRKPLTLHFLRDVDHFIERRRDESAQTHDVRADLLRFRQNLIARHHHAHVDHLVIVTSQHDADDVFSDVVHVAFHRCHEHFSLCAITWPLLRLHERQQKGDGFLHHASRFYDLREKHFSLAKQVADDAHPGHQRTLYYMQRSLVFSARFLHIGVDKFHDSFHQRVTQTRLDGAIAPFADHGFDLAFGLHGFGKIDQPLGRIGATIQDHVLDEFQQISGNVAVNFQHSRIDDSHVESGPNRMIEKRRMHGLAHRIVAAE